MSAFLSEARREEQRLAAELQANSTFVRLEAVRNLIAAYAPVMMSTDGTMMEPSKAEQQTPVSSPASEIIEAAEAYLATKGQRAQTAEILNALLANGLVVGGQKPGNTLSSYLSNTKSRFNHERGKGYGLASWPFDNPRESSGIPEPEIEEDAHEGEQPQASTSNLSSLTWGAQPVRQS